MLLVLIAFVFFVLFAITFLVLAPSLALFLAARFLGFCDRSYWKAVSVIVRYLIANIIVGFLFAFICPIIGGFLALVIPEQIVIFLIILLYLLLPMLVFIYIIMQEYNVGLREAFLTWLITIISGILLIGILFIILSLINVISYLGI